MADPMAGRSEATLVEERSARWHAASYTHPGARDNNEDSVAIAADGERACFVVADGLGGHAGGERASRLAVDAALEHWRAGGGRPLRELLGGAIEAAHAAVRRVQRAEPALADMRTTLVVLMLDGGSCGWAHVGDTRLYRFESGRIAWQTKDHSVPQFLVANGELDAAGIRNHPDRSRLLGTLGNDEDQVFPSLRELDRPLTAGDSFALCTDGFWEDVLEPAMEAGWSAQAEPRAWVATLGDGVQAKGRSDRDNCTVLAVRIV
jgi:serine/threonine protein phosphatase PrpC